MIRAQIIVFIIVSFLIALSGHFYLENRQLRQDMEDFNNMPLKCETVEDGTEGGTHTMECYY